MRLLFDISKNERISKCMLDTEGGLCYNHHSMGFFAFEAH